MGKFRKYKNKHLYRHDPLDKQILKDCFAQASSRNKIRRKPLEYNKFVDSKLVTNILKQSLQQQEELEEEEGLSHTNSVPLSCLDSNDQPENETDFSNSIYDFIEKEKNEVLKLSEEEEKVFEKFMGKAGREAIAEDIKDTLTEKQTEFNTLYSETESTFQFKNIDSRISQTFEKLVPILKEYKSGPLPKNFKAIPKFVNWEQILQLTKPQQWSAATMCQATRIFSSNLEEGMAQRFYNKILLPRVRDEIAESRKLNVHMYNALKKALYKPAAFFKGIVIPFCQAGNGNEREATIISSVLAKNSIPVLHSSAALLTIAEMEYTAVNIIFMRVLIEKKYALPYRVVNGIVDYFLRFKKDKKKYPVLWHQCLLTFVQIYKIDLSPEQKTNLLELLTVQTHKDITPEIRKELEKKIDLDDIPLQTWKI